MDEIYFAVGPETWGRGTTEEEAVKNCKVNWPHWAGRFNKRKLAIFCTTDKDAYIDGMDGTLEPGVVDLEKVRLRARGKRFAKRKKKEDMV